MERFYSALISIFILILVLFSLFIISFLGNKTKNNYINNLIQNYKKQNNKPAEFYEIPVFAFSSIFTLLIIVVTGLILLLLLPLSNNITFNEIILPLIILSIIFIIPLYFLFQGGIVILNTDSITIRKFFRTTVTIRFHEIISIKNRNWQLPGVLLIRGKNNSATISIQTNDYHNIYSKLLEKIKTEPNNFIKELILKVEPKKVYLDLIGFISFSIIFAFLFIFVSKDINSGIIIFILIGGGLSLGLSIVWYITLYRKSEPIYWEFNSTGINSSFINGRSITFQKQEMASIEIVNEDRTIRASGASIDKVRFYK
ncbi:MAG: hypothetical protein KDK36_19760, partial [Leptospiraceae bacterium]|nr:hypothetical protein [Leptospiraceae bacterium]